MPFSRALAQNETQTAQLDWQKSYQIPWTNWGKWRENKLGGEKKREKIQCDTKNRGDSENYGEREKK